MADSSAGGGGILGSIATALGFPSATDIQAQANVAAEQLQTAFAILIGEGAIAIALLVLIVAISWKERR